MPTSSSTITEPPRQTPVIGEYDVVVLGGGPAGLAAAAAAGQHGRRVLLIERYGFLGGMGTAAGVTNFCGLHANVHGDIRQVVHGVADDLLGRIDRLGGLNAPHMVLGRIAAQAYDTAAFKCAADDLLLAHKVDIRFHALAVGVVMDSDTRIKALLIEDKSGRGAVLARSFIDCSGDGDLAAFAGARFEKGDEHGNMLYPTTMFRVNNVDAAAAGEAWRSIPALMDEAEKRGVKFPRKGAIVRPMKHSSEWRVNVTQVKNAQGRAVDATDAGEFSAGEIEGRKQAIAFFEFLRREAPGFADAYVVDIPPQLGVRETRRVTGLYQLTADDVLTCASFDDSIGVNGWPIENHAAGDVIWRWQPEGSCGFNHLPYRMLVAVNAQGGAFDNLMVAGRCASMTHEGQSAARVSGGCFVMGQAAGTAAHLSLAGNGGNGDIPVAQLQETLARDGAYLGRDAA
ncbi:MAG: FAD-dependent oxidoreductase [Pseudolabrys sp.]|nr:FAD-dependent oxidoreductase [Pseudolabrys sp.]